MLTVSQAAAELKVSSALIYALVDSGALEAYKFSTGAEKRGTIRIEPSALQAYKQSRKVQPCPSVLTERASVGASSLKPASPAGESALQSYFRKAGVKLKPRASN